MAVRPFQTSIVDGHIQMHASLMPYPKLLNFKLVGISGRNQAGTGGKLKGEFQQA
jgi:hypothetical protein